MPTARTEKRSVGGRPPLPVGKRKRRISLSVSPDVLRRIDSVRGDTSRSGYIEKTIGEPLKKIVGQESLRKRNGAVYTPSILARFVAKKLCQYYLRMPVSEEKSVGSRWTSVVDPACGDGELLVNLWDEMLRARSIRGDKLIHCHLCGVDIDGVATKETQTRIEQLDLPRGAFRQIHLLCTNALFPLEDKSRAEGWKQVCTSFGCDKGFDMFIANPPWGAEVSLYEHRLAQGEYETFQGQCDTSDLFVELALSIVRPGGLFAFILPDSLFALEREKLRGRLLRDTEIKFIGRFGEKLFDGINRACCVLVCRVGSPSANNRVDCMRLTPRYRNAILQETGSFEQAEKALCHKVKQRRFSENRRFLFDIDIREEEKGILTRIEASKMTCETFLASSRGTELSKTGRVCRCPSCELWFPRPMECSHNCPHCQSQLLLDKIETSVIIGNEKVAGHSPLIVGESILRYQLQHRFWIDTGKNGINYKENSLYRGPKIVVRKTGVGISASLDYSGSYVNQVVYIMRLADKKCQIPLEFFLGILNSRAIYYYLVKSHGETEWRSHPYVTQTQIGELPVPLPYMRGKLRPEVLLIARTIRRYLSKGRELPVEADANIERMVAKLFGLERSHYRYIYRTIDEVEELLPIKLLKRVHISQIFRKLR